VRGAGNIRDRRGGHHQAQACRHSYRRGVAREDIADDRTAACGTDGERRMMRTLMLVALLVLVPAAQGADIRFENPEQQARYEHLINELRCLVCQNQTIADSNADLALDLRSKVAEQIAAGKSDDEVIAYLTARYGDFVLYR